MQNQSTTLNVVEHSIKKTFKIDAPDQARTLGYEPSSDINIPKVKDHYVFRKDQLRDLLVFLSDPEGDAFYLSGPTGSGKSSLVTEVLGRLNWPCQDITAHGRLEMDTLVGQYELSSVEPGKPPEMKFRYGVLPMAMKYGHVLLINEIDYCDPSDLGGLNDILEGKPLVITQTGGEVIHPHPMFRVVVTGNSVGNGDESGLYRGVRAQNIAFLDRFRVVMSSYMDKDVEEDLLKGLNLAMPSEFLVKMVEVANSVRTLFLGESGTGADGTLSVTMSTRTLIRWAKLASKSKGADAPMKYALDRALCNRADSSEALAIHKIAEGIFGEIYSNSAK